MSNDPTPNAGLVDSASLNILYAQEYTDLLFEVAEDLAANAKCNLRSGRLITRFHALSNALEHALAKAKTDVDSIVVTGGVAFKEPAEILSTPSAPHTSRSHSKATEKAQA